MTADHAAAQTTELLAALVRARTVNPMGGEYECNVPVERPGIEIVEEWLTPYRDRISMERQSCGTRHENLVIRLEGKSDAPAALFESHLDTVPAEDWGNAAFEPVITSGELFGRGACDDKGSMTAMIAALVRTAARDEPPPGPVVLVCAGDEEFTQSGIRHFLEQTEETFAFAVFGEPTQLNPVVQHMGSIRWDLTVRGKSAHTSRPDLGRNAILGMVEVVAALGRCQQQLQQIWHNPYVTGPLLTVTMIEGGRTRNSTPDECTIAVDFRTVPGMDAVAAKQSVVEFVSDEVAWEIRHSPDQLAMPPLQTDSEHEFCQQALAICRDVAGDTVKFRGEPYGTDAAWLRGQCPAIVLGPGDIAHAHAIDEKVAIDDVVQATEIYARLMQQASRSFG
ncbi:M20/M25/M40 family metallo-hydrolase [Pirellulales bacterium]|nr:M20/M25/M40 family metallo-hydrolase [Pirellulales bacterium]